MDILTKIDTNKQWNARFLRAFDWLCTDRVLSQANLAKIMNTNSSLISAYRAGQKRVSEDMINRLLMASAGRIYKRFILGKSDYMLIKNVSDEQIIADNDKEKNPDYAIMHPEEKAAEPAEEYQAIPKWADSLIQLVSSQTQTIEDLRREITTIRSEISTLREEITNLKRKR